jgi:hypothetical protein
VNFRRLVTVTAGLSLVVVTLPLLRAASGQADRLRPPSDFAGIANLDARSKAFFGEAALVMRHARCVNCHPDGDRPLQGNRAGYPHQPPVQRGDDEGRGVTTMRCTTCHGPENFDAGRVPGVEGWRLADRTMAWEGKSAAYICRQILDPGRNGGHDKDFIVRHLKEHPLVGWAWSPGAGRESAPGTWQEFRELIDAWDKSGAKCP